VNILHRSKNAIACMLIIIFFWSSYLPIQLFSCKSV